MLLCFRRGSLWSKQVTDSEAFLSKSLRSVPIKVTDRGMTRVRGVVISGMIIVFIK